jgi:hypothetical protein
MITPPAAFWQEAGWADETRGVLISLLGGVG